MRKGRAHNPLARRTSFAVIAGVVTLAGFSATAIGVPSRAAAASSTYYFHGTPSDEANKWAATPSATFDQNAPTGTSPVGNTQQAVWPNDGPNFSEGSFDDFWLAPYSGTLSGSITFSWYWSSTDPAAFTNGAKAIVTVFADPVAQNATGEIAQAKATLAVSAVPTLSQTTIPLKAGCPCSVASHLLIEVSTTDLDPTGVELTANYDSTAVPSSFTVNGGGTGSTPTPTATPSSSSGGGAGPGPSTFTHEVTVDPQRAQGEPDLALSDDGTNLYSAGPWGFSTTVSFATKSSDGGVSWTNLHGECPTNPLRPSCSRGGGDAEVQLSNPVTGGLQRVQYEDLNGLDTISCSYSDNGGDTFNDLAAGNVAGQACNENINSSNPNDTAPPGTDRPWVAVCPQVDPCAGQGATADKLYMVFDTGDTPPNGDAAMSSTDGGQTWQTQCTSATLDTSGNLATCVGGPNGFGTRPGPLLINVDTGTLYEFMGTKDAAGTTDGAEVNISCDGGVDWASVQIGPFANASDNNDTNDFVVGAIDSAGGIYAAWTKDNGDLNGAGNSQEPWQIMYTHSIDPAGTTLTGADTTTNGSAAQPGGCTKPVQGGTWSAPVALNGPANSVDKTGAGIAQGAANVNFAVMPWITAGDPGRVAIGYYGSTAAIPYDPANQVSPWYLHVMESTNAQDANPGFTDNVATEQPMHTGSICFSGLACTEQSAPAGNRNLADFFQVKPDPVTGRAVVIFADDNNSAGCGVCNNGASLVSEVQQASGPSLYRTIGRVPALTSGLSQSLDIRQLGANAEVTKAAGNAILASPGHNLAGAEDAAADVTDFKVISKDANTLGFVFTVSSLSGGPQAAVVAPHTGASWLATWKWNNDLWFAQASTDAAGNMSYIAGRPLSVYSDSAPKALEYTTANNSEATAVTGAVDTAKNTIEVDVPLSAIGGVATSSDTTDHVIRGLTAYTGAGDAALSSGSAALPGTFSGQVAFFDNIDQLAPMDVNLAGPGSGIIPEAPLVPIFALVALVIGALYVQRRRQAREATAD